MRATRTALVLAFATLLSAIGASSALAAFGVEAFQASTCTVSTCTHATLGTQNYTQAGGHPGFGITDIRFNSSGGVPEGSVKDIRVDVPPGLNTDPFAIPQCTKEGEEIISCPSDTKVGEDQVTTEVLGAPTTITLPVYNLVAPPGSPLRAGIPVPTSPTYIIGGISPVDYHEYFTISNVSNALPILEDRLIFYGAPEEQNGGGAPNNAFLTLPSACSGPEISHVSVDSYAEPGHYVSNSDTAVGSSGCELEPFEPTLNITPSTTKADTPNGATIELQLPQNLNPVDTNSSDLQETQLTLPPGMTINPSVTNGVTAACTPEEFAQGTTTPITCPEASVLGTVSITTPDLNEPLTGSVYLGSPNSSGLITAPPYAMYLAVSSARYGVYVRLVGSATPNPETGQLTVNFPNNPEQPFSKFKIVLTGGETTSLANPLSCGATTTTSAVAPYSGTGTAIPMSSFLTDLDGLGGACPSSFPFAPALSTSSGNVGAGAATSFTENASRADEEQNISTLTTQLPPGLLGLTPSVALCAEAAANAGSCGAASLIGSVSTTAGAGSNPLALNGSVYLTGPYKGSPFGLSVVVPVITGPFRLGNVVVRAQIQVNSITGQITAVSDPLPQIFQGIPIRLRGFTISVNRPGFLTNPTSCAPLTTTLTLNSTTGATASLNSPFQMQGCSSLPFSPKFSASTSANTSRANGAGLTVTITQPKGQANIRSVVTALPVLMPSRLTTLQKACVAATFNANPASCPPLSIVGSATANTPVLSAPLSGPAYLVSHGGAAFPDLVLLLHGEGVTIELVGNTYISSKGITSTTFATLPDAPISSFQLTLPTGPDSLLGANGSFCTKTTTTTEKVVLKRKGHAVRKHGHLVYTTNKISHEEPLNLVMPTTITAQSGVQIQQQTPIVVSGCPGPKVKILSATVKKNSVSIKISAPSAGVITVSGSHLRTLRKTVKKAGTITVTTSLTSSGRHLLQRRHHLTTTVKALMVNGASRSQATKGVTFKKAG